MSKICILKNIHNEVFRGKGVSCLQLKQVQKINLNGLYSHI